jgi:hypothetical protein
MPAFTPRLIWALAGTLADKRLRIYFLYDRKLLAKLSICGWKVLSAYLKSAVPFKKKG